jgi:dipeptidyl aminopeptidase/acylaminoacyl peptidase
MKRNVWNSLAVAALITAVGPGQSLAQPAETAQPAATAEPAASVAAKPAKPLVPVSELPAEAFAKLPFIEDAELSPDGTRIAGLLAVGGQTRVSIFSLFDPAEKRTLISVPDGTEAAWINWVNNDNIVVGLYALLPIESGDRWYISRMIGINRVTGKVTKLLWDSGGQNAADVVWYPSNGSSEILVAAQYTIYTNYEGFWPTVYRVDVAKGSKRTLVKGREGVMDWNADAQGNVRTGWSIADGGRRTSLIYRPEGGGGSFRTIDRASTKNDETINYPFLFLPGTDRALVRHNNDKGKAAIYEIDLLTQQDVRTVFTAPGAAEVTGPILSSDRTTLLGAGISGADHPIHWFDKDLAALQDQFSKAVGDRRVRISSFSADRKRMLVSISRADMPGSLYFYNVDVGALQKIGDMNPILGSRRLSPVKLIQYKARDGLQIEGVLTLPAGKEASNLPIIMMPHGGPWGHDDLRYDYWAQFLASKGYAVLQPNFRGSTGYGDEFERKGQGQMGLAMQDDITDGLRWAVEQKIADPKRACIVGASYGGYAAMWGIVKDPDLYKCAISISGVSTIRREVNDMGDSLAGSASKDAWRKMTPDFAAVSPLNAVARITKLIHGKKDVTVDHNQSTSMNNRMREAGKEVEFVSVPLADHHFTREEDRITLLRSIETFLAKHNPAGKNSPPQ